MECVIDCSLALAWVLPDEASARAERFLERLPPEAVLRVPGLWWYELSNALIMAQRRKRLADVDRRRALDLFKNLPIETDLNIGAELSGRLQGLAHRYTLSAYDAAYLDLAQRLDLGLGTIDRPLAAAARRAGVRVLP